MSSPVESGNIQGRSQYEANRGVYEKDLTKANLPQPYFFLATALVSYIFKLISLYCKFQRSQIVLKHHFHIMMFYGTYAGQSTVQIYGSPGLSGAGVYTVAGIRQTEILGIFKVNVFWHTV